MNGILALTFMSKQKREQNELSERDVNEYSLTYVPSCVCIRTILTGLAFPRATKKEVKHPPFLRRHVIFCTLTQIVEPYIYKHDFFTAHSYCYNSRQKKLLVIWRFVSSLNTWQDISTASRVRYIHNQIHVRTYTYVAYPQTMLVKFTHLKIWLLYPSDSSSADADEEEGEKEVCMGTIGQEKVRKRRKRRRKNKNLGFA